MKHILLLMMSAATVFSSLGCSHWNASHVKPTTTTTFTQNRDGRINAVARTLVAKGYSEDRAKQVAAKQVPWTETTTTVPLSRLFSGSRKQDKFYEDLAKSEAARPRK
tara:strand:- start:118 stop:441 length:324 start_codon:yes stop_codon:yes gene_type:complete